MYLTNSEGSERSVWEVRRGVFLEREEDDGLDCGAVVDGAGDVPGAAVDGAVDEAVSTVVEVAEGSSSGGRSASRVVLVEWTMLNMFCTLDRIDDEVDLFNGMFCLNLFKSEPPDRGRRRVLVSFRL